MEHHGSLLSVGRRWYPEDVELGTGEVQELVVTTMHDPPYTTINPQPDGSYNYSGYLYDLWETIAKELNIRFRMVPLLKRDYGSLHENGTWSGMVGDLAYGRADVALNPLFMRPDRAAVLDYLDAYPVRAYVFKSYVRREQGEIPQLSMDLFSALLKPLHVSVWWTLLASVLLLSVVLWISEGFSRAEVKKGNTARDMTWPSSLLSCFMAIVGQGWASTPSSLSARVVTLSCWMLGIIITTSYTANLISHLTVGDVTSPITSLKEFLKRMDGRGWKLSTTPGHASINDWKVSSDPYERELYRRTVTGDGFIPLDISSFQNTDDGTNGKVMFYTSANTLFQFFGGGACDLVPVPNAPEKSAGAFMVISKDRKRLRRNINRLLLKMGDVGLIKRIRDLWVHPPDWMCEKSTGYKAMAFGDTLSMLLIMPLTMCACLIIFCLECLFFKYKGRVQGWRMRGFEGARVPPRHQNHPPEIKENFIKHFVILSSNKNMKI